MAEDTVLPVRFLSTLSLRRATTHQPKITPPDFYFYPRSPCGERQHRRLSDRQRNQFLSTLSLRRATWQATVAWPSGSRFLSTLSLRRATPIIRHAGYQLPNFYPRSPCGERPKASGEFDGADGISIHALLAESDRSRMRYLSWFWNFYPRSPCGERPS